MIFRLGCRRWELCFVLRGGKTPSGKAEWGFELLLYPPLFASEVMERGESKGKG